MVKQALSAHVHHYFHLCCWLQLKMTPVVNIHTLEPLRMPTGQQHNAIRPPCVLLNATSVLCPCSCVSSPTASSSCGLDSPSECTAVGLPCATEQQKQLKVQHLKLQQQLRVHLGVQPAPQMLQAVAAQACACCRPLLGLPAAVLGPGPASPGSKRCCLAGQVQQLTTSGHSSCAATDLLMLLLPLLVQQQQQLGQTLAQ